MVTAEELLYKIEQLSRVYPNMPIKVSGQNDRGDLINFYLTGDVLLERASAGSTILVLR